MDALEKGAFIKLFNRGGFILDLSTADFDALTMAAVGVPLVEKYKLSKGKSLIAYTNEAPDIKCYNLFKALMDYYETDYNQFDIETCISTPLFGDALSVGTYGKRYQKCKTILAKYKSVDSNKVNAGKFAEVFDTNYMNQQIKAMLDAQESHPSDAIGKAKELIESCCRTILIEKEIEINKNWSIDDLTKKVFEQIHIMPKNVSDSLPEADVLRQLYGNLRAMVKHIAEVRNIYGTGHGRDVSFEGLEARHARLIVGMSTTLVNFLWESHVRGLSNPLF